LEPFVKNLSNIQLSDAQLLALSKGLKHIPTPPKPDRHQLVSDVNLFHRRMRIRHIMRNKKSTTFHKFRLPSKWTPLDSGNIALEDYLERTKSEISHLRFKQPQNNISREERKALNDLSNNPNIIIKKYDKGRGICLMNKHDYTQVGLNHLSSHHYELIPFDSTTESANEIHALLHEMHEKRFIDSDALLFVDPIYQDIHTSEMYFLPKLHKKPTNNNLFEARPIVSGINSATYSISSYLDYFLSPIAASQSTYIRDSTDIILKLQNISLPPNALLAAIDIKAMYTNINHQMAIKHASEAYDSSKIKYGMNKPPTEYISKLISLVLENNTFKFAGLNYKQKIGLAMGSPVSCSLANISLHPLELEFLEKANNILCFFRYLDDIILISTDNRDDLNQNIDLLNDLHPDLKFTAEISNSGINFLDIHIYKGKNFHETGKLDTKIFTKPCDTFQYIQPSSTHPPATFKGFIHGEFLRFARITSEEEEFHKQCTLFKKKLLNRGYAEDFIDNIAKSVSYNDRQTILQTTGNKKKSQQHKFPLVFTTTFSGHLTSHRVKTALLKNWHIISGNQDLKTTFPDPPLIAFKRTKNIQDKLVKAKLPGDGNLEVLLDLINDI
jgi:hypothetical protein